MNTNFFTRSIIITFGLFFFVSIASAASASTDIQYKNNRIIIQLKNNTAVKSNGANIVFPDDIALINKRHNAVSIKKIFLYIPRIDDVKTKYLQRSMRAANVSFPERKHPFKNFYLITFPKNTIIKNIIDDYKNMPDILSAEPNQPVYFPLPLQNAPNKKPDKTTIENNYAKNLKLINAEKIEKISSGSPSIIIAILDSGIDTTHPAFFYRLWVNKKEKLNAIDDDSNGFIDDINGYSFQNFSNYITDTYGHGTFIAALIGALPADNLNFQGLNRYSPIMPVKISSKNGVSNLSALCQGIYYAVNNGADIINISIDNKIKKSYILRAILNYTYETGCIIIISTNFSNKTNFAGKNFLFSKYNNIISVGQLNSLDQNFPDNNKTNIFAPDKKIVSLSTKKYPSDNTSSSNNRYITASDSYASTAFVSGAVSLMLSVNAGLYIDEVKNIIKNTSAITNENFSLLNCYSAVQESSGTRDRLIGDLLSPAIATRQKSLKKIIIRGGSLVKPIIEKCENKEISVGEKGILIHSLGEIKSNSALSYLIEEFEKQDNNYLKRNIIDAIGKIGDPSALNILIDALSDSNAGVRYKSAMALGRLGVKEAGQFLMDKLTDPDERVVTETIESITKIKYEKCVPRFCEQIKADSVDQFIKNQMVFSIGEMGNKRSLATLLSYKKNLLNSEPSNNIVKYKWKESIKIVNEAIKKIESRNE
ncbi:S8 family serine peptidase [bacterium]|nr:S8 family serine peptidase [bacterium]